MSYGLQLNPGARRRHIDSTVAPICRAGAWPRIYAQLIGTHDIFEISRGIDTSMHVLRRLSADFGPRWHLWHATKAAAQFRPTPSELSTLNSQLSPPLTSALSAPSVLKQSERFEP